MICYVLDTDTCIYWLKGNERIRQKVLQVGTESLGLTVVTLAELKFGAYNSKKVKENLKNIDKFLSKMDVLPLNPAAADKFGTIKACLRKEGRIIEDFDILIASITISYGGVLVTNNVEHFKRIAELNYENWLNGC